MQKTINFDLKIINIKLLLWLEPKTNNSQIILIIKLCLSSSPKLCYQIFIFKV